MICRDEEPRLTVGELRKQIADLPAETPVVVYSNNNDETYVQAECHEARGRIIRISEADENDKLVLHVEANLNAWVDRYK